MSNLHQFVNATHAHPDALQFAYRPVEVEPWLDDVHGVIDAFLPGVFEPKEPSAICANLIDISEVRHVEQKARLLGRLIVASQHLSPRLFEEANPEVSQVSYILDKRKPHKYDLRLYLKDGHALWHQRESIKRSVAAGTQRDDLDFNTRFTPSIKIGTLYARQVDAFTRQEIAKSMPAFVTLGKAVIKRHSDD